MIANPIVSSRWYVLYIIPNHEKKVRSILSKNNVITFLPLQKVERKWSDRKKIIEVPLFPNYLFIKIPEKERFKVLDVFGVKWYIKSNGSPVLVDDYEIENIKKILFSQDIKLENKLVKGDKVKICKGPFEGMRGVLYEKKGQTRLCVRIESINQILSIEVCSSWISKISN